MFGNVGNFIKPIISKENVGLALGLVLTPTADALVDKFVPQQKIFGNIGIDDVAILVASAYFSRRGGFTGNLARGVLAAKTAQLVYQFVGPMISGLAGGSTAGNELAGLTVI